MNSVQKGRISERQAAGLLRRRGYCIINRAAGASAGDADLIICHAGCVVFVEVKISSSSTPSDLVTMMSYCKRFLVAVAFLTVNPHYRWMRPRIDVMLWRLGQLLLQVRSAVGPWGTLQW